MSDFSLYQGKDYQSIITLFSQTFSDSEGEESGNIIANLVNDLLTTTDEQALKIFVAKEDQKLIGCILLTPLHFSSLQSAYLLSPVATLTAFQGKGIAQGLINLAKTHLKQQGVELLFTYGDPNFYCKVGFEQVTVEQFPAPHPLSMPHGWLAQSLNNNALVAISGSSSCAKGLDNPTYW